MSSCLCVTPHTPHPYTFLPPGDAVVTHMSLVFSLLSVLLPHVEVSCPL